MGAKSFEQFGFEQRAAFIDGNAIHESDGGVEPLHHLQAGGLLFEGFEGMPCRTRTGGTHCPTLGLGDEADVEDAR